MKEIKMINENKKIELLAPAGSMEALIAAVNNGADAVYLGGIAFSARSYANNFDRNSLVEAISFCHEKGVNVYVAMNILVFEHEMDKALEEVDFYYNNQVDALIVQDLGLFSLIRKLYPDFEVHCSTQMHIHNLNGVKFMKEKGASRVILARETPIEIIQECASTGVDIEVFSYGALCMSYSGQCMMSSILQNRSGNRGVCAQYCRLQYRLYDETDNKYIDSDEYLLSPKDLNLINKIPELIKAGVTSLKIEGRMKRSEYVGLVVSLFRKAIDSYYENIPFTLTNDDLKNLKLMFNREFTEGKVFSNEDDSFMNNFRPNHIGVPIGKVVSFNKNFVNIQLTEDLNQEDGIRILNKTEDHGLVVNKLYLNNKLVNKALKGDIVSIDKKGRVDINDLVVKTTDIKLNKEISRQNSTLNRKVNIEAKIVARVNEPLVLYVSDGVHFITKQSDILCQKPIKSSVTFEKICEQLNKTNDTPYKFISIDDEVEDIFIPLKTINELRRECLNELSVLRINKYKRNNIQQYIKANIKESFEKYTILEINNENQLNLINDKNLVFTNNKNLLKSSSNLNYLGYTINENNVSFEKEYVMANQIGDLYKPKSQLLAGYGLNATNSYTVEFLLENSCLNVCYSLELDGAKISRSENAFNDRFGFYPNTSIYVYGKRDMMITKQKIVYPKLSKKPGSINLSHSFSLEDKKKEKFNIILDDLGYSHLLEDNYFSITNNITKSNYYRFTTETKFELKNMEGKI